MPKLAIYVSKPDMKAIDRWRKRINFSQIFIKAVFTEIRKLERTIDAPEGKLAAAADFYRSELTENSAQLVDFGYSLGSGQVIDCQLVPEQIREIVEIKDFDASHKQDVKTIEKTIGKQAEQIDQFAKKHGYTDATHPMWRMGVYRGYLQGVAEAWRRVCQQIAESTE